MKKSMGNPERGYVPEGELRSDGEAAFDQLWDEAGLSLEGTADGRKALITALETEDGALLVKALEVSLQQGNRPEANLSSVKKMIEEGNFDWDLLAGKLRDSGLI
jgi:hypothetical protein